MIKTILQEKCCPRFLQMKNSTNQMRNVNRLGTAHRHFLHSEFYDLPHLGRYFWLIFNAFWNRIDLIEEGFDTF